MLAITDMTKNSATTIIITVTISIMTTNISSNMSIVIVTMTTDPANFSFLSIILDEILLLYF